MNNTSGEFAWEKFKETGDPIIYLACCINDPKNDLGDSNTCRPQGAQDESRSEWADHSRNGYR